MIAHGRYMLRIPEPRRVILENCEFQASLEYRSIYRDSFWVVQHFLLMWQDGKLQEVKKEEGF